MNRPLTQISLRSPPLALALLLLFAVQAGAACIELSGTPQQGALLWARVAPGSRVFLNAEALPVSVDGIVVFGFGRDAPAAAVLRLQGERRCEQALRVARREYVVQRVSGVPRHTVTPAPGQLARIRREAALVEAARAHSSDRIDFIGGFQWPVTGPVSGVYGSRRIYNGTPGRPHYGVDVAVPEGTAVTAPAAGVVVLAEPDLFYSGGTVIIDHGARVSSTLLHLSAVLVGVGQAVAPGDIVAEVGSSGRASGPHLDWRMNWREHRVDPALLVPPMP